MKTTKYALTLWLGLIAVLSANTARANPLGFTFAGTLSNSINGSNTITGQFTLDTTVPDPNTGAAGSITTFNFLTPIGPLDSANSSPSLFTLTPAVSPNLDFVVLLFDLNSQVCCRTLQLIFETDLSSFSGSTFYTGLVNNTSILQIQAELISPGISLGPRVLTSFATGSAALVPTPEPSSLFLLGTGVLSLMARTWRRKRLA